MCFCVRERESDLCALTLMRLRKSKYAPQLSELHGVNKNKVSVFMHLLYAFLCLLMVRSAD